MLSKILVKLGSKKKIDYQSIDYLRSRGVQIGENVNLYNTNIDFGHGFLVKIGDNVTLTGVTVLAHDASTQIPLGVSKVGRVTIGNNVFVGHGSIILPNTIIGDNVVIGAGTVVSKNVPAKSVVIGNPMRVVGTYDDFVKKHENAMIEKPVFQTFWAEKTKEQKEDMYKKLENCWGYDE